MGTLLNVVPLASVMKWAFGGMVRTQCDNTVGVLVCSDNSVVQVPLVMSNISHYLVCPVE